MYFAVLGIINYNQSADFNKNSGNNARKKNDVLHEASDLVRKLRV